MLCYPDHSVFNQVANIKSAKGAKGPKGLPIVMVFSRTYFNPACYIFCVVNKLKSSKVGCVDDGVCLMFCVMLNVMWV